MTPFYLNLNVPNKIMLMNVNAPNESTKSVIDPPSIQDITLRSSRKTIIDDCIPTLIDNPAE